MLAVEDVIKPAKYPVSYTHLARCGKFEKFQPAARVGNRRHVPPIGKGREVDELKTRRQPRPVFFRGQKPRNFFSVGGESRRKLFQDAHFFTVITHKSIPYKGANPRPYFLL